MANMQLDPDLLRDETMPYQYKRNNVKLWLEPWGNLFATEQPGKGHRTAMLNALLDIYESWDAQLSRLGQPYYLKVWLFDPNFMQSQIVCAWGEAHDLYQNAFTPATAPFSIPTEKFADMDERLQKLNWKTHLEEAWYFESDFDDVQSDGSKGDLAHKKALLKRLKSKGCPSSEVDYMGKPTRAFALPLGHVWIGGGGERGS